jgi:hypothetical protein
MEKYAESQICKVCVCVCVCIYIYIYMCVCVCVCVCVFHMGLTRSSVCFLNSINRLGFVLI